MARPRLRERRGLADNLYYDSYSGLYRYRHPVTKTFTWLSRDRNECMKAAQKLNAMLIPASADLVNRVVGGGKSLAAAIDGYNGEVMPELELAAKTEAQYLAYHRRIRKTKIAKMAVADVSVRDVVACLDELTAGRRMRNIYRHRLIQIFRYAMEQGWCDSNPAEVTRKVKDKRRRERLTLDGYKAIYEKAPHFLQVAMDLTLQTLQRPEDLVLLRYDDERDGCLPIQQQKTGTKLLIPIGPELREIIDRSRDRYICPFIIHDMPRRLPSRDKRSKYRQHHMQVFREKLSKAFADARAQSGYYRKVEHPPTFYEIKSLGGDRYREQGWSEERIQQLMGHKEVETTRGYLAGHEVPWVKVECGLKKVHDG